MRRRLFAEALGTGALVCAVVGSGIMAERLAGGNVGIALLANSLATAAALYVLITALGPVSGAHLNPAVTLAFALRGELAAGEAAGYAAAQIVGGVAGTLLAHAMFDVPLLQFAATERTGANLWLAECVAAFGLMLTILAVRQARADAVAAAVALYILAAYWFTASTSFANPAVTIARALTDSFAGIRPVDAPPFVIAQLLGALAALLVFRLLSPR